MMQGNSNFKINTNVRSSCTYVRPARMTLDLNAKKGVLSNKIIPHTNELIKTDIENRKSSNNIKKLNRNSERFASKFDSKSDNRYSINQLGNQMNNSSLRSTVGEPYTAEHSLHNYY